MYVYCVFSFNNLILEKLAVEGVQTRGWLVKFSLVNLCNFTKFKMNAIFSENNFRMRSFNQAIAKVFFKKSPCGANIALSSAQFLKLATGLNITYRVEKRLYCMKFEPRTIELPSIRHIFVGAEVVVC